MSECVGFEHELCDVGKTGSHDVNPLIAVVVNPLTFTLSSSPSFTCPHCGAVTGNLWCPTGTTTITWPAADSGQAEAEAA
jgi:hypothetical protein